jgi:hypothetical protein
MITQKLSYKILSLEYLTGKREKKKKSILRSHMRMVKPIDRYIMTSFSYALQGNGLIINISLLMEIKPYN